jgi:hypothetical protein
MFFCDEWCDCAFITRWYRRVIAKLVYINSFWEGVQEVCTISEPWVKVLCLVDVDNPTMGYLYEAMDRDIETIQSYYVGKGTFRYDKYMMIWNFIDSRWTKMLHCSIHVV